MTLGAAMLADGPMSVSETKVWVGQRIREAREQLGLSQSQLGERLHKTQAAVSYWENGKRSPTFDDLLALCRLLDKEPAYFLATDEYRRPIRAVVQAVLERFELSRLNGDLEHLVGVAERLPAPERDLEVSASSPIPAARELLLAASVDAPPVDVEHVARRCGVLVIEASFDGPVSAVAIALDRGAVIGIDQKSSTRPAQLAREHETTRRFMLAHHLGHHVLRHHERFDVHFSGSVEYGDVPVRNWAHERDANDFAVELLMPADLTRSALAEELSVERLAERFAVSPLTMAHRLIGMGLR